MNIIYGQDLDYLEVIFEKTANHGESLIDDITVFKSEKNANFMSYSRVKRNQLDLQACAQNAIFESIDES